MAGALRIDRIGDLLFRAVASREPAHHRIFDGQIMAQALLAAGRTVAPSLDPHLLHARFFRSGEPNRDVDYQIGPFTDRGSFAYRQVVARQGDRQIMELTASFHRTEDGPEHQFPACAEADPEGLPTFGDLAANSSDESARNQPFEKASQHMHQPMEGVRVLEVAQFTFVPAAAAVLSDWGAEVIKVEHAVTGDAQRGLVRVHRAARFTRSWRGPTAASGASAWRWTSPRSVRSWRR
jgi:acyl-CoA thioesterase II